MVIPESVQKGFLMKELGAVFPFLPISDCHSRRNHNIFQEENVTAVTITSFCRP